MGLEPCFLGGARKEDPPLGGDASCAEGRAEVEDDVAGFEEVRRQVQGGDPQKWDTGLGHLLRAPMKKPLRNQGLRVFWRRDFDTPGQCLKPLIHNENFLVCVASVP